MRFTVLCLSVMLVLCTTTALAEGVQPSQQYAKQYLSPFYRASTTANTNYTYTLQVGAPDGISTINSAIITFDMWIAPTVTFTLWVNNRACNNPTYTISTTYASAGRAVVTFDCTNIITAKGEYTIILRPTQANTGAVTAWADLSYMNDPQGKMSIMGTEYSPGDPATMFVQLKDSSGNPVNNGSCYLDIVSPLNGSFHKYLFEDIPMIPLSGNDGLYFYDMTAPSPLGIYMLSARCAYSFNWVWIYPETENAYYPTQTIYSGAWEGNASTLNSREDGLYLKCSGTLASPCNSTFTFNVSQYGSITNITNINVYFSGQSDATPRTLTFSYYNGTTYIPLNTTLIMGGTAGAQPTQIDEFYTSSVPTSAVQGGAVRLLLTGQVATFKIYHNWLSIAVLSSSGTIQDVKGSGEMHITNIPKAVWAYPERNLTNANVIWNHSTRLLTDYHETNISDTVWTRQDRNLTYYPVVSTSNLTAEQVWNYTVRNLTHFPTYANLTASEVWEYASRNLTYYLVSSTSNLTAQEVWDYAQRNLTYTQMPTFPYYANLTADEVWNFTNRSLTQTITAVVDTDAISEAVWNYSNRSINQNVTASVDNNAVASAVWAYIERNLTYYQMPVFPYYANLTASEVWAYATRTLTDYAEVTIANAVWSAVDRNLTYYQYFNPSADVWVYADRNLTWFPPYINPATDVWTYADRNLTYYAYTNPAGDVWTYIDRNLTYYAPSVSAGDIWVYPERNLTYYPSTTDAQAVWNYTARYIHGEII